MARTVYGCAMWLTASDTQIVPPSNTIPNVAFSPDGNYVYFRKAENAINSDFNIYRTPVLGGTPQVVAHDVDSSFAFSPDGDRMAYFRANDPETGKWRFLSAKLDGSDEKVLHIEPLAVSPALAGLVSRRQGDRLSRCSSRRIWRNESVRSRDWQDTNSHLCRQGYFGLAVVGWRRWLVCYISSKRSRPRSQPDRLRLASGWQFAPSPVTPTAIRL